ncbi:S1 family peptidase [Nonomuraea cavernae]|uniref:Serine protease n=1 Tax=Nonomuraea cavernae TaxID=2045107 RepID=A0A917Z5Q6_9ACTN|nr:S1 family peptidase [Nonomuraea cavernae]MCA2188357.1 S1 family peptidase [Nonomuraea cavernae]GGO73575.1 serine protease [Nonomuraea cavernae]
MLRTPALIAIAIGALVMTPTPAVAAKPPSGMIDSLQRDLGISKEQAVNRLANEARGNNAAPGLRKQLGDRYAGAWYEGPESVFVVATVDATDKAAITRSGAQARVLARTMAQLTAVKDGLDRAAAPSSVHAWSISPQDNAVIAWAADLEAARTWVEASGVDAAAVKVEQSAERPRLFYDIRGGDAYYNSALGYRCSVGFAARRGTQLGYTSAGHCGNVGNATTGYNQVAQGSFQISSFPGNDYSWISTNANWTAPGVVNAYGSGILPVRGSAVTQPGGSICRSGSTTQWHCGTVQALNSTVNYPEGTVSGLTRTNVCAEGGDSGGSFISGDQAQGMTSGGSGNCTSGGTTYFQPVGEILSAGGLTLVTSGGQEPPTGCQGYSSTYSGSLTSGQSVYQPNGSYYQSTTSGTHAGCLDGPNGTDFDLYLQKWNGSSWSVVAQGITANPDETISYSGTAGYYRYRVHAYSGSGSYTLGVNRP